MVRPPHTTSANGAAARRKPDRRRAPDRRNVTRKGRRGSDPEPRCPSCGLLVPDRPHASKTACISALRAVLERLISEASIDAEDPFE